MRHVTLDVVIPKEHVWEFMAEFGTTFAMSDEEGNIRVTPVNSYYDHPGGWHINVTVWDEDESRFYIFLNDFCSKRNLHFER